MIEITRRTPFEDLPALLRVEEAAAWMDCSKGVIYEMAKSGQLASMKIGRLLRIKREGLTK